MLSEMTKAKDAPSVPLPSGSKSFSLSAFMNIDSGGRITTFGGVNQLG